MCANVCHSADEKDPFCKLVLFDLKYVENVPPHALKLHTNLQNMSQIKTLVTYIYVYTVCARVRPSVSASVRICVRVYTGTGTVQQHHVIIDLIKIQIWRFLLIFDSIPS